MTAFGMTEPLQKFEVFFLAKSSKLTVSISLKVIAVSNEKKQISDFIKKNNPKST